MKNLRSLPIFACLFLFVLIPMRAEAIPPPSPAGGNYLVLDGVDDHAILDFKTFGLLLPKGTDEFTFEAWIYPTTLPNKDIHAMVLSQQVWMDVMSHDHEEFANLRAPNEPEGDLMLRVGAHLAEPGVEHSIIWFAPIKFSPNQWNHIAFESGDTQKIIIVNDFVRIYPRQITLTHDISPRAGLPQDFILGGFREKFEFHGGQFQDAHFWGHFVGYIDEIRISKVARYNVKKKEGFTPDTKFKNDAKTVALWHFDESRGAQKFLDTSGNAYHLVGKNGAMTDGTLAVEAEGKLAITWGRLKQ